jgi:hypothetical protein
VSIRDDLVAIERGFWTQGADYYRQNLDDVCVTAFAEMAGAFKREEIAGMIKDEERWRDLNMGVKGFLEPIPGFAILTYEAQAHKAGRSYRAVVTSSYVMRNGAWKMVLHQQTPLE